MNIGRGSLTICQSLPAQATQLFAEGAEAIATETIGHDEGRQVVPGNIPTAYGQTMRGLEGYIFVCKPKVRRCLAAYWFVCRVSNSDRADCRKDPIDSQ